MDQAGRRILLYFWQARGWQVDFDEGNLQSPQLPTAHNRLGSGLYPGHWTILLLEAGPCGTKEHCGPCEGLIILNARMRAKAIKIAFPELWDDFSPEHISAVVLEHRHVEVAFQKTSSTQLLQPTATKYS